MFRSARGNMVHKIEQVADQEQQNHTETVNTNFINFDANYSVITAN